MKESMVNRIVLESLPVLTFSILIEIVAGAALGRRLEFLVSIPLFLSIIPPLNELGNGIACIVSSRIATSLHLGTIELKISWNPTLRDNFYSMIIVGLISSFYLSSATYLVSLLSGTYLIPFMDVILVGLTAGFLLTLIITLISTITAFISWYWGLDPDNVVIPITTSLADLTGIYCLFLAIDLFLIIL